MIIFAYLITFSLGFLTMTILFKDKPSICAPLFFCLSWMIGLSWNMVLGFANFILLNQYHRLFIIGIHLCVLAALVLICRFKRLLNVEILEPLKNLKPGFLALLTMVGIIAFLYGKIYPYGGWDAWQVWNFKAKFLLLSGSRWKELFDPILWRTSPHYALGLPLLHVWTWSFSNGPVQAIPLFNTVLFNILSGGLVFSFTFQLTKNKLSFLPAILIYLIPTYLILATSQYADILIGLFLMAGLCCFVLGWNDKNVSWLILSGLMLGMLCFFKPEGLIASGLVAGIATLLLLWAAPQHKKALITFWAALIISAIPTMLFQLFLSPGNQTFTNGFASADSPSTLERLKTILAFLMIQLTGKNWHYLWILLFVGGVLNLNRVLRKEILLIPLFLACYLGIVILYYWINTYFPIAWWLAVSASRILASLLPVACVWIFAGILCNTTNDK